MDTRRAEPSTQRATSSLSEANHAQHDRIRLHLDQLVALAEMVGRAEPDELDAKFQTECSFVTGELGPHMLAVETTVYDELERRMGQRHSMAPMREEHERFRLLMASLCRYGALVADRALTPPDAIGLRRVLYRLYTMLSVHLAEEELYLGVLDRSLTEIEKDALARSIEYATAEPL
ncbi:MAG: hemerythrin domain-containing protein [Chloroflexota bacterium]